MNRIILAVLIVVLAAPALADARSEAALRDYLNAIDAGLAWSATAGNIRSEGDTTIAEDVEVSRTNPAIALTFDVIRFDDLAIGTGDSLAARTIRLRSPAPTEAESRTRPPCPSAA